MVRDSMSRFLFWYQSFMIMFLIVLCLPVVFFLFFFFCGGGGGGLSGIYRVFIMYLCHCQ